jgi:hypothetical protein
MRNATGLLIRASDETRKWWFTVFRLQKKNCSNSELPGIVPLNTLVLLVVLNKIRLLNVLTDDESNDSDQ